jgi:hypothetical protein
MLGGEAARTRGLACVGHQHRDGWTFITGALEAGFRKKRRLNAGCTNGAELKWSLAVR